MQIKQKKKRGIDMTTKVYIIFEVDGKEVNRIEIDLLHIDENLGFEGTLKNRGHINEKENSDNVEAS